MHYRYMMLIGAVALRSTSGNVTAPIARADLAGSSATGPIPACMELFAAVTVRDGALIGRVQHLASVERFCVLAAVDGSAWAHIDTNISDELVADCPDNSDAVRTIIAFQCLPESRSKKLMDEGLIWSSGAA
jgi:hypothetical protein